VICTCDLFTTNVHVYLHLLLPPGDDEIDGCRLMALTMPACSLAEAGLVLEELSKGSFLSSNLEVMYMCRRS
jgi:hypothetical protein